MQSVKRFVSQVSRQLPPRGKCDPSRSFLSQSLRGASCILLLAGLISCTQKVATSSATSPSSTNPTSPAVVVTEIQDVQKRSDYAPTLYVQGTVGRLVPFLGMRAYELQDATGKIWVVTKDNPPRSGDTVLIKGQVKQQRTSLAGQQLQELYIEEQEQLAKTATDTPPKPQS